MFEIIEYKSLIIPVTPLKDMDMELEFDAVGKLCFQADRGHEYAIFVIKEWLEANFRMYQYKKDNGVKYGEHELFYWHREDDNRYFTVDIAYKNIADDRNVASEILRYVSAEHKNAQGNIILQFETIQDWTAINRFVMELDISVTDRLPLRAIASIALKSSYVGDTLTLDNRDRLSKLEAELLGAMRDRKVYLSANSGAPIKGTLRQLESGAFALFKSRAKKTYYRISLQHIADLKAA